MSLASTKIIQSTAKELRTTPEAISLDANLALIGLGGYNLQRIMWEAGIDVPLSECANLFERVSCLVKYADEHDARRGTAGFAVP